MLIFENKVPAAYREAFIEKVIYVSNQLGINPNWLMAVMHWESAGTFSASVKNNISGATGLIQFMPNTAVGLGTTTAKLAAMTAVQQLDFVLKYFKPYKAKIKSYVDLYLVTFFPVALGKEETYILKTSTISAALIAKQNPAFDTNKDGTVQLWEIKKVMLSKIPSDWLTEFEKKKKVCYYHCWY